MLLVYNLSLGFLIKMVVYKQKTYIKGRNFCGFWPNSQNFIPEKSLKFINRKKKVYSHKKRFFHNFTHGIFSLYFNYNMA